MQTNISIFNALQQFETQLGKEYSHNTKIEYARTTKAFILDYFRLTDTMQLKDKTIPKFMEKDIMAWYKHLLNEGSSNVSLVRYRQSIKKWFEFIHDMYQLEIPNVDSIELPKVELSSDINALTDTVIRSIVYCTDSTRDRLMIQFLYETGMKRYELINCKKADLELDKLMVRINKPNGELDRYGFFSEETRSLIVRYMGEWLEEVDEINKKRKESYNGTKPLEISEYLFQTVKSPLISYATVLKAIYNATYAFYYAQAIREGKDREEATSIANSMAHTVDTEVLRHSRRAWHFAQGKSIEQVMAIMGDENSTLCKRYLKIAMKLYPESFR